MKIGPVVRKFRHHVHAGMSYGSIVEVMVSMKSQAKIMQVMRIMQSRVNVGYPGSGSKSTATKFRGVLTGLLGLDLPVAVVQVPDTKVLHNSDILHLEIVSQGFKFIGRNSALHAAYGSSAPAAGTAWAGAWACEC
jgi:hypothetical protein